MSEEQKKERSAEELKMIRDEADRQLKERGDPAAAAAAEEEKKLNRKLCAMSEQEFLRWRMENYGF